MEDSEWEHVSTTDCQENMVSDHKTENVAKQVTFTVNGVQHVVTSSVPPRMTLVDFIRDRVKIKGTKVLCRQGGCGVCTVVATIPDPSVEGKSRTMSVNACQVLVYSCSGWQIETIENLGNRHTGYNDIQKSLVANYGTQCGFCSPGMVMSMYGEMKGKGEVTQKEVERSLDGNICRCTGYRPIMDAFKALASDAPEELKTRLVDIEDSHKEICCKKKESGTCEKVCGKKTTRVVHSDNAVTANDVQWYQPSSLTALTNIIQKSGDVKFTLVAGNTAPGVYKEYSGFDRYISLHKIADLHAIDLTKTPVSFGASVSLAECIKSFEELSSDGPSGTPGYRHLKEVANHWKLVANTGVRNVGSWAGNLMMRHAHREFPSDISMTLSACDASLILIDVNTKVHSTLTMAEFYQTDLKHKLIIKMTLPDFPSGTFVRTYKISRRAANAHAYVSSAIRINVDHNDGFKVKSAPGIFFAGINPSFETAAKTSAFLNGKKLSDGTVVKTALETLGSEVIPNKDSLQGGVEYRKSLALALLYKTFLWLMAENIAPELKLGGDKLVKRLTKSQQVFDENKDTWPLGQPVPKIESSVQVSGEAEYTDDIIPAVGELEGAFVQSTEANAKIEAVDATEALAVDGVEDYISAADVPGYNSFVVNPSGGDDKIFATERVQYQGQPIGLIIATSKEVAKAAAKLVKVTYSDVKKPVLTIKEAMARSNYEKNLPEAVKNQRKAAKEAIEASDNSVKGEMSMGTQFHFIMEPLSARVLPTEDGFNVASTTQFIANTQNVLSEVLGVPANSITMNVRRLGGGFGGKISRGNLPACAAAVAAVKTRRPVRVTLDLEAHMTLVGWREPFYGAYEVGFTNDGKLQAVNLQIVSDTGFVKNDSSSFSAQYFAKNVYHSELWSIDNKSVTTDTAANTWCRTPGPVQGIAFIENIMDHVATYLKKDPLHIREINLFENKGENRPNVFKTKILPLLKEKSLAETRKEQVKKFNSEHKWRKKGFAVIPFFYPFYFPAIFKYTAQVAIYEKDGTVAICHGGIEMGQGINTKAAQVAAHVLGVDLSTVKVRPSNDMVGANSFVTGGSYGSDLVAYGVSVCCTRLKERIDKVKEELPDKDTITWPQLIKKCSSKDVDLAERYWTEPKKNPGYDIFGGGCLEVELDVLTGQYVIRRVDIVEDVGRSMSPLVDMGQIEGALMMGLGMFTTEEVVFNEDSGAKLTNNTWDYKPPTALDIPEDLRVTFLPNTKKEEGMLSSKATGEPPFCLAYGIVMALRDAIAAARADGGVTGWFNMDAPLTVEKIHSLCYVKPLNEVV